MFWDKCAYIRFDISKYRGSHQIKTFKRSFPLKISSSFSLTHSLTHTSLSGVQREIGCVENSGTIQNVNLEEEEKSISSRYIAENNLKDQYDLPPTRFEEPIWFHKWNTEIDISKSVNPNVVCPMNQKTTPVENNNGSITSSPLGAPCPGGLWLLQVVRASGQPEYQAHHQNGATDSTAVGPQSASCDGLPWRTVRGGCGTLYFCSFVIEATCLNIWRKCKALPIHDWSKTTVTSQCSYQCCMLSDIPAPLVNQQWPVLRVR